MHKNKLKGRSQAIWLFFAVAALVAVGLVCGGKNTYAAAGINQKINYQGRLYTSAGAVIPDGNYNIQFSIVQDGDGCNPTTGTYPCSGTTDWTETYSGANQVMVKNGYFSVELGSLTSLPTNIWNLDTLWLSINIGGTSSTPSWDGVMKPMKRLDASPYALNAMNLQGLNASNFVQLAQGVQTDSSATNPSIFINKTNSSGSPNILELQKSGVDVLDVTNNNRVIAQGLGTNATYGSELAVSPTCTGTNWSGSGAGPYTHTAGSTVGLVCSPPGTVTAGGVYQVVYSVGGTITSGESVRAQIGGVNGPMMYSTVTNETEVISATGTSALTFTPSNNFNGTVSVVSIKQLTMSSGVISVNNSDATAGLEIRAGGSALNNTFVGLNAAEYDTTGNNNVALGSGSFQLNTLGSNDVALGYGSMLNNSSGAANVAVGSSALSSNTSGSNNTALGTSALAAGITGSNNTALGYYAGYQDPVSGAFITLPSLQNATMVGYGAEAQLSNSLILGGAGTSAVNVGVGTTSPTNLLSVSPDVYDTGTASTTASATVVGAGTTWTSGMVGMEFIFANGNKYTITGYTDATHLTLNTSSTNASQAYRIHNPAFYVSSTGQSEFRTSTNSANAFQVQNSTGVNLFNIDDTLPASELISNGSFEIDTSGWSAKTAAATIAITADSTQAAPYGANSMKVVTSGTLVALDGVKTPVSLLNSTAYSLSFWIKVTSGSTSNIAAGYSLDGSTVTACTTSGSTSATLFLKVSCTFTTTATPAATGSAYIFIGFNDTAARTAYIDGVALEQVASGAYYKEGRINSASLAFGNILVQSTVNSNQAFTVASSTGNTGFNIDTNSSAITSNYSLTVNSLGLFNTVNSTIFRVRNSTSAGVLINADNNVPQTGSNNNAINNNASFENGTTGWAVNHAGVTMATDATTNSAGVPNAYSGATSLKLTDTTSAIANTGVKYNLSTTTLASTTTYSLSFYAKLVAGQSAFTTLTAGRAENGSTETTCSLGNTTVSFSWQRYTCSFTTGATSGTPYIYIGQSDAGVAHQFYIDAVTFETTATANNFREGRLQFNGDIISPSTFRVQSDSTNAFQIQNSSGYDVIAVDTTPGVNLVSNPGFETGTTGWAAKGSAAIFKNTVGSNTYEGQGSLNVTTTALANDGATLTGFTQTVAAGTYTLSFYALAASSGFSTLNAGYNQGAGDVACTLSSTSVVATGFQRYTCTFTTTANLSSIFINQSDATARTFYIDGVQLESGSSPTAFSNGGIELNGVITSPVTIKNSPNNTTAFQVQNSSGTALLAVDSLNNRLNIGAATIGFTNTGNANQGITLNMVVTSAVTAGDVVVIDTANAGQVTDSTTANSTKVFGIATQTQAAGVAQPIVVSGVYQVNVDSATDNVGDYLVTSSTTGAATDSTSPSGGVVGQILSTQSTNKVWAIINPQSGAGGGSAPNNYGLMESDFTDTGATLPGPVAFSQTATIGNYVYIFGGANASGAVNTIYRAPVSNPTNWINMSLSANGSHTLPGNLYTSSLAVIGTKIYLFGGYSTAYTNVIYSADTSDPLTWTSAGTIAPATNGIGYSQTAVIGNYVYLFGGYSTTGAIGNIYRAPVSDPTNWTDSGKALPTNLYGSQVAVIGNYVYLFGGYNTSSTNVIYRASVSDPTTWSDMTTTANGSHTLPSALHYSNLAIVGNYIYLISGGNASAYQNVIWRAAVGDPLNWSDTAQKLPTPAASAALAVVGNALYIFGGYNASYISNIYSAPIFNGSPDISSNPSWKVDSNYFSGGSGTSSQTASMSTELAYSQFTSSVSVTTTSQTTIVSAVPITTDGNTKIRVEFAAPYVQTPVGNNLYVDLYDGSTLMPLSTYTTSSSGYNIPGTGSVEFTPSAGSHTYSIVANLNASAAGGLIGAGTGTGGAYAPGYIRITLANPSLQGGAGIQNGTTVQTGNFNLQSSSQTSVTGILKGATSQSADVFEIQNSSSANLFRVDPNGNVAVAGNLTAGGTIGFSNTGNANQAMTVNEVVTSAVTAGDVVVIDTANAGQVTDSTTANSTKVFGIATQTKTAGQSQAIVISGIYQVNVISTVTTGDYLVTSSTTGQAQDTSSPTGGIVGQLMTSTVSSGQAWALIKPASGAGSGSSSSSGGGMTRLYDITLSSNSSSLDVPNIPSGYDSLKIVTSLRTDGAVGWNNALVRFNNDSGSNYSRGNGGSTGAFTSGYIGASTDTTAPAGAFGTGEATIPNYTNTTVEKSLAGTYSALNNTSGGTYSGTIGTTWASTAAINEITLFPTTGSNFVAGSRVTVYGVGGTSSTSNNYSGGNELAYNTFSGPVSVTHNSDAAADTIVTSSQITSDGSPLLINFYSPWVMNPTSQEYTEFDLFIDGVSSGQVTRQVYTFSGTGNSSGAPANLEWRVTPSVGTHTYSIRAFTGTPTTSVYGGGVYAPGFVRITLANPGLQGSSGINNGTVTQIANFNIQSSSANSTTAVIQGATSQSADILDVETGTGGIAFSVGSNGNAYVSGNLGIGITGPTKPLYVVASNATTGIAVGKNDNLNVLLLGYDNTNNIGTIGSYASGSASVLAINPSGGNVGIGTSSPASAKLYVSGAANGTSPNIQTVGDIMVGSGTGSSIFFDGNYSYGSGNYIQAPAANTMTLTTAGVERLRVNSSGNVGIGTNNPGAKLTVQGTDLTSFTQNSASGGLLIQGGTYVANDVSALDFKPANYNVPFARIGMQETTSGSSLIFGTSNNYSTGITNSALTIDYSGNAAFSGNVTVAGYGAVTTGTSSMGHLEAGTATLSSVPSGGDACVTIYFSRTYGSAPSVVASNDSSGDYANYMITYTGAITTTSASLCLHNTLSYPRGTQYIHWFAM